MKCTHEGSEKRMENLLMQTTFSAYLGLVGGVVAPGVDQQLLADQQLQLLFDLQHTRQAYV